jgi:hypothetical protein
MEQERENGTKKGHTRQIRVVSYKPKKVKREKERSCGK